MIRSDCRHVPHVRTAIVCAALLLPGIACAQSQDTQLERGLKAVEARAGCFFVDYSFVETAALKPGYVKDNRVYDVTKNKSVKEWIVAERIAPTRIRLQHVLQVVDPDGKVVEDNLLKHTGEEWEFNAPFFYDFVEPGHWQAKNLAATPGLWTRRILSLDDGPRYACAAAWKENTEYADWSCSDKAPIPGRETRDMKRKDYNELDRLSRVLVYDSNWLEREENTKVIHEQGVDTPLAKEVGKIWYARLPDAECAAAQQFVQPRLAFWKIVREAWDEVLTGNTDFIELPPAAGQPSRYEQIQNLEAEYLKKDLSDPAVAGQTRADVLRVIRANSISRTVQEK